MTDVNIFTDILFSQYNNKTNDCICTARYNDIAYHVFHEEQTSIFFCFNFKRDFSKTLAMNIHAMSFRRFFRMRKYGLNKTDLSSLKTPFGIIHLFIETRN